MSIAGTLVVSWNAYPLPISCIIRVPGVLKVCSVKSLTIIQESLHVNEDIWEGSKLFFVPQELGEIVSYRLGIVGIFTLHPHELRGARVTVDELNFERCFSLEGKENQSVSLVRA